MMNPRRSDTHPTHAATLATLACALAPLLNACGNGQTFRGADAPSDETLLDLINFGQSDNPEQLIDDALNVYDPDDRARGIAGIASRPFGADPVFVDLYRGSLDDDDAAVRAAAARALATHGRPQDVPRLAQTLQDDDRLVRWHAARALQRLHGPDAVGPLITRLSNANEQSPLVRTAAATALGQYAQPRVLDALVAALDDPDLAVNSAAERSLQTLTGRALGDRPEEWVTFLRNTQNPFADRQTFTYPAFQRNPKWFERINPWDDVPTETAATPLGMPPLPNR